MYKLKYKIKTQAPILISSDSGDANMVSSMDYIPGTVLSGIFAWKYIDIKKLDSNAHEDEFFNKCFLNSGLCFSNAYISKEHEYGIDYYFPTPLSVQHEKNNENKIFDLLYSETDEQTKRIGGYCSIKGNQITGISPEKSLNFHHNRNREKGTLREKLIFNYESLDRGQEFSGRISGSKNDLEIFLKIFGKLTKINIGKSKNIQYGQAIIEFIPPNPVEFRSDIESSQPEIESEFILTLLSPAIIYNEDGFSTASVLEFEKYFAESIGIPRENLNIHKKFIKPGNVENFVSVWLLKKPSETTFDAGSCFKIEIEGWNETIKNKLLELQEKGIGERRNEGFGRFVLNWQNPLEVYKKSSGKQEKIKKPEGSLTEIAGNVLKNAIVLYYQKLTENKALSDCFEFCKDDDRLPSNSLLGRLEIIIKKDGESFSSIVKDNLRDTAQNKLKKCRNESRNLFEFITENEPDIKQTIFNQKHYELKIFLDLLNYNPDNDKKLKDELYTLYWITFLRFMRKQKRGGD